MEFPYFPFYPKDFLADANVAAMTTEEIGAYLLLLCYAWQNTPPGSLPSDDSVLARFCRLSPDRWTACRSTVLACFTLGGDGKLHQKRMRSESRKLLEKRQKRVEAGSLGGKARAENLAMLEQSLSKTQAYGSGSGSGFSPPEEGGVGEGGSPNGDSSLGAAWVFYLKRKKNRTSADDPADAQLVFDEMMKFGLLAKDINAEIVRKDRDHSEYLWQFKKRMLEQKKAGGFVDRIRERRQKRGEP